MAVDLRSDTVTRPCAAMRREMAEAVVGDDVYGEDPTVVALEVRVAALLGKDAALFVPSGTMANQIALMLHCRPGDEVVVAAGTHCMVYESGASAAWAGVQFSVADGAGHFDVSALDRAISPPDDHAPRSRLVVLENSHNRAGGVLWPRPALKAVSRHARERGLAVHLDGARLWNASVASGESLVGLAACADTVSVCFSKGLGAPVGSALVGDAEVIHRARRLRKMLGGGMRQSGVLAAAALHALEHHLDDLARDHQRAQRVYSALDPLGLPSLSFPQTNILCVGVPEGSDPHELVRKAAERGVLCNVLSPTQLRLVTHRDLSDADVDTACEVLVGLLQDPPSAQA